jgi:hypothetical protein
VTRQSRRPNRNQEAEGIHYFYIFQSNGTCGKIEGQIGLRNERGGGGPLSYSLQVRTYSYSNEEEEKAYSEQMGQYIYQYSTGCFSLFLAHALTLLLSWGGSTGILRLAVSYTAGHSC